MVLRFRTIRFLKFKALFDCETEFFLHLDINECEGELNPCATGTYCKNTEGSHECVSCHLSCEASQGCTGEGQAQCSACAPGWQMEEGAGCVDVDECAGNKVQCKHGEVCVNKDGPDSCEGSQI